MTTENMPTTNQGAGEATLADKIPPTVAAGFKQAAGKAGGFAAGEIKKAVSNGMSG